MEYIERKESIITGKANLEPLHTFKDFPVFFGCVDTNPSEDIKADMSWTICPESGIIQLDKLIPLDVLYQEQHVDGIGPTWERYYQDFASYILKQNPGQVLEIGGGAGRLAHLVTEQNEKVTWTIVEPNPWIEETDRVRVKRGFFDESFQYEGGCDTVVFSQVLEHAYDPHAFIRSIAKFLKQGEKLVCAYPNLEAWLKQKYTNAINFEHNMFLTDYFVDFLLKKYGFEIKDKHFYEDHSVYYVAEKISDEVTEPAFENKYVEYKSIFEEYIAYYENLVKDFNEKMENFSGEVYIFGAHIFSQHLLQVGLKEEKITAILDNSPKKEGKRLYGSHLRVENPEVLRGKQAAVILKVGVHRDDILKQLLSINPDVVIFE